VLKAKNSAAKQNKEKLEMKQQIIDNLGIKAVSALKDELEVPCHF
jgi:hypothetical protein